MCGFIGRFGEPQSNATSRFARAASILRRRGPDSEKLWISPTGNLEIFHVRLAIVDQGGIAHQPMTDPKTGVTIAFNGEIYNYSQLRAEFETYPFLTNSDTEVFLASYDRWGIECLPKLRGFFSAVIADTSDDKAFLVRDPVGKKPLFTAEWGESVYFGSSVLALVALSGQSPDLNQAAAGDYWMDGHVNPSQSVVAGCRPIKPGEVVELRLGSKPRSFRIVAARGTHDRQPNPAQELSQLLQTAVTRRLQNNPNPVSLLSGGVDSTVVTKAIREQTEVHALSLRALIPYTLDEKYARYAARKLDVPLTTVPIRIHRIEDEVDFALSLQDEPLGMMSFLPLALLLREVKTFGKILFSGDGGDEVFLGYGKPSDWIRTSQGPVLMDGETPCGPSLPDWMSAWARKTVTHGLVGHMFTKLDRSSAEQGIEVRCPLLDWDLMSFARSLEPQSLVSHGPKSLLKSQLQGWPAWFVDRPKMGFTWHLRWAWAARRFAGLRERIVPQAIDMFSQQLPRKLTSHPMSWSSRDIFGAFPFVFRLLAWSAFLTRLNHAQQRANLDEHVVMSRVDG